MSLSAQGSAIDVNLRCRAYVQETKKADEAEHQKVFHRVGLLFSEPPGTAGLPSI